MATKELTSAEVVYALVDAEAVGKLTVTGVDGLVVITGSTADRDRARKVLKSRGFTCTKTEDRDEVTRPHVDLCGDHHASGVTNCTRAAGHGGSHHNGSGLTWGGHP